MDVTEFDFEFTYKKRVFKARCHKFKVANYPQYRVAVFRGKVEADIYLLYEVKNKKQKFFWYKLPDKRNEIVQAIVKRLTELGK
jgi:hypothetical protein